MRRLLPIAVLLFALAGCGRSSAVPVSAAPVSATAEAGATAGLGDYDAGRDPAADIKAALAAAGKDKHNVLIDFGADWCLDCRVLTKLSTTATVAPMLRDGYHVVSVDVGEFDRNLDVAAAYRLDLQASGIPALVVLDPAGKVRVATNDGAFSNARTMDAGQVADFLSQWR